MKNYFKIVFFLLFVVLAGNSKAQFYSTGQDPASSKWNQINTDHFQIIFQEEFSDKAQYIANTLDFYYNKVGETLKHKPKKISVIVHNQTIRSNGYVSWAPKRMELYTTPSQDAYPDIWLKHLCIHELRHVVQIDKLNQGITKILSLVFGQQGTGLVAGQLPMWYYEGDAVCAETAYSKFGRGRLPYFQQGLKAHLLSDEKMFSFDKMLFGSYQEYTPNHYEYGYQLTSYARMKYGKYLWSEIEDHVAKNSYTLLPTSFAFYRGLKKQTGLSQKDLYEETMFYLKKSWETEIIETRPIDFKPFQDYDIFEYEDYLNPIWISDTEVLALKKGYSHIPQFVVLTQDSERVVFEPGVLLDNTFSYANGICVWAEYKPDKRWQNREYNSIRLLNVQTGINLTLIDKSRYFSPALSSNAEKIALIEVDESNNSNLLIISAFSGELIQKIEARENNHLMLPKWSKDNKSIYFIELTEEGKQISKYNLGTKHSAILFKSEHEDIQRIVPDDNKIYFLSTLNGTDNIYVFDESTQLKHQVSNSKFGISDFDIDANSKNLIINEKTSQGFRISKLPIEKAVWRKVEENEQYRYALADSLKLQEESYSDQSQKNFAHYTEKPYRKALHLFNFHSWVPFSFDYENMSLSNISNIPSELSNSLYPGIMLLSQNKLSTVESILNYAYKNGNHFLSSAIELKGQYPIFRLSAEYGAEQVVQTISNAYWQPETKLGYTYKADVYIPFNLSKGKYIRGFVPLISVEYKDNIYYNYQKDYYIKGMEFVHTQLLYYAYERQSEKDIIPKLGAVFRFNLYNTPFESELFNYLFNVSSLFYLPSSLNRGFIVDFGYQYQRPNLYLYSSSFSFPRGIPQKRTEKMLKLYVDYVFPIAYPEWNLGSALYVKRLRGNLFADYAYNSYRTVNAEKTAYIWPNENNFSFGLELKADYHLLRTIFPLNSGVRLGYSTSEQSFIFNVLFGIELYN